MVEVTTVLPEFPGFAVKYDVSQNPFFMPIVIEDLRKIASVELGKTLFRRIGRAAPRFRSDFPLGINVMVKPLAMKYSQAGMQFAMGLAVANPTPAYNPTRSDGHGGTFVCPFCAIGGSANAPVDPTSGENGTGSVCDLLYTNAQIVTGKGEATYPFIVFAHELIHSYHNLYGVKMTNGNDEELKTTGLGRWAGKKHVTENHFRELFGIPLRVDY